MRGVGSDDLPNPTGDWPRTFSAAQRTFPFALGGEPLLAFSNVTTFDALPAKNCRQAGRWIPVDAGWVVETNASTLIADCDRKTLGNRVFC